MRSETGWICLPSFVTQYTIDPYPGRWDFIFICTVCSLRALVVTVTGVLPPARASGPSVRSETGCGAAVGATCPMPEQPRGASIWDPY